MTMMTPTEPKARLNTKCNDSVAAGIRSKPFASLPLEEEWSESPSIHVAIDVDDSRQQVTSQNTDDRLRDQTKRLSHLMTKKTELYGMDPMTSDPPECSRNESSGLHYWVEEVGMAKEHGGDYARRHRSAARAALGSFITFSVLVFPHQEILGAVWIGNIFMHSNVKDSFGASLISVLGFGRSIIMTTAFSWPVAYFLSALSSTQASIILPFLVFVMSFLIMTCPQLTGRNLMILVMYIVVAAPVRDSISWWMPFGYVGTYFVGLATALLMNSFNTALHATHRHLARLEKDLTMLMLQCKAYGDNTAGTPYLSRSATASIEMLYSRIALTVKTLKAKLGATKMELALQCKSDAAKDLSEWVMHCDKLLAPLKSVRTALQQRVIGEEYHLYSIHLRDAKVIIQEEISGPRDRMMDAMIASIAVCHAWADPSANRTVLPDVHRELKVSIKECRQAFHRATVRAARRLEANEQTNIPVFAHLIRRMSAFNALFELGDCLLSYLEEHNWEMEEDFIDSPCRSGRFDRISSWCRSCIAFMEAQWLWYNADSFRLALKTSVGMFLASIFVSVPYLWNISDGFGIWPGLTVASVNLATTGSSFSKASDRLFGTLLAAVYALLVSDLFPGNVDAVKIPAIAFFTYSVVYLRNEEHAYKYTYAATSIGSMLYGSVKNEFNIAAYIPKRIELIFVGVVIFSIVELLLFPRSSRKMVESLSFQFFLSVRDYINQAGCCARLMEEYVINSASDTKYSAFFDELDDPFHLIGLAQCHEKLKKESSRLKKELDSGLNEPLLGLGLGLDPESFRGLAIEQSGCEIQAVLLLKSLKKLAGYYQDENHPVRELDWPRVHAQFLEDATNKANETCESLKSSFPDGRLRAQQGNSVKAVITAAALRGWEDVRLRTISGWSENYSDFIQHNGFEGSDPIAIMTLGVTTTFILELCHHLQKAGKHVEKIAHRFPAFK